MAITTRDELINALAGNFSPFIFDKASLANQTAGRLSSTWRATGYPAQGAIPTTAAVCDNTLTGALPFTQQTAPAKSYLALLTIQSGNAGMTFEVHDRLAHIGGFVGNVTSSQTVTGFDLDTLGVAADRLGVADLSEVECFIEGYTDLGATASTATINVTFTDTTSGNLTGVAVANLRQGSLINLRSLQTTAQQGKIIKQVNSVQLSASTGTAGNFGFTFYRRIAVCPTFIANVAQPPLDWAQLGLPVIPNEACIVINVTPGSTTTTGIYRASGNIIHG